MTIVIVLGGAIALALLAAVGLRKASDQLDNILLESLDEPAEDES